jgi:hypothetical protein
MLIRDYISQLCGETPTDLRMGVPAPTTNFARLTVTLIEIQRKTAVNSYYQSGRDARELEDRLEAQLQRFAMLGINADSCNALSSHFFGPLTILWLNHKHEVAIQNSFDTMVEIRKTSLLPRDWIRHFFVGFGSMSA